MRQSDDALRRRGIATIRNARARDVETQGKGRDVMGASARTSPRRSSRAKVLPDRRFEPRKTSPKKSEPPSLANAEHKRRSMASPPGGRYSGTLRAFVRSPYFRA